MNTGVLFLNDSSRHTRTQHLGVETR
uniref:Uncharacterized protein n=1 Tax=Anguilla anguilla TaxID=7936 RepID=A0A0E9SPM3_ANGAN